MTHDCDRATECPCFRAGYLRGQQADVVTMESLCASMEESARGLAVVAILALAGRFVAGLAGLEALEFASGVVFVAMAPMAAVGYGHGVGRKAAQARHDRDVQPGRHGPRDRGGVPAGVRQRVGRGGR